MGKLIVVPTPIGNLGDITLRALEALKEADIILAEDTRQTGKLLKHFDISTKMKAHHKFNEHKSLEQTISHIQNNTLTALVSDAGTPSISDPGFLLTRACIEAEIEVECLPGATALIPALVKSGYTTDRFIFEGFLPHKKGKQTKILSIKDEEATVVFYESPHRIVKTLKMMHELLGDRNVAVVREITKIYEECIRGNIPDVIAHYEAKPPKGEIVLVVEGKKN